MTALMHSLIVLEKRDQLYFWVIILCLLTFILSVTGTFLVRSGILNSVHTFANDPSRGTYILIFLSIMILVSVLLLFKKFKSGNYNLNSNSKETFILINNWFMIFYLITVLLGTIYPIFTEVLSSHKVSVGPPFYNTVIIPIVVLFLFFMSLGPQAKWIKNKFTNLKLLLTILLGSIFINFLIFYFFKSYSLISNLIIISSFFLILSSLRDSIQIVKNKNYNYPRIVSHTAFGFLILFIGLNYNFSSEKDFNFKLGDTKQFENFSIKFQKLQQKEFKNYTAVVGKFKIKDLQKKSEQFLNPEIRIYKNPSTLTYEASIRTGLLRDYYITMSNIDRSDYYNIKFQKKPFMIWIWISVIFISIGGFLRLFQNANKNY
jgi:cytochrome c-type biogenesis protein CcmF